MAPYNPPTNAFYTQVAIPEYVNSTKFMKHLYSITERSGCEYMWVDLKRNVVEIWGPRGSLPRAVAMSQRKIANIARQVLYVPHEIPEYLKLNTRVFSWRSGGFVNYKVFGDVDAYFRYLCDEYPPNPYCTCKRPNGVISRLIV